MRFARITLGLLLTLSGLAATVAGAVAAFWLVGPDNTITTPSRQLASTGLAVVSAPSLLDRHGPTLHVSATGDKPLFIGVGQDLDVRDYLSGVAHTQLVRFDLPATFGTQEMRGRTNKLTPPGELDWWVAQSATGAQSLSWPVQDGRYDVVVMNADGSPAVGAHVTFGIQLHRLFGICLLILGAGILVLAFGLWLLGHRRPASETAAVREVAAVAAVGGVAGVAAVGGVAGVAGVADTTELPTAKNTRIPVLVSAPAQPADNTPAYHVSPFHPHRVSPFAPVEEEAEEDATPAASVEETTEPAPAAVPAASPHPVEEPAPLAASVAETPTSVADLVAPEVPEHPALVRTAVARTAPVAVPAAPMFMSAAAVARAKAPVLIGVGAAQRYDQHQQPQYEEPAASEPTYDETAAVEAKDVDIVPLEESPEFVRSDEAVRRTAALLASGAMLLTATSCGLMPAKNSLTVPDSRPAVTLADAQAVVQRYNQLNNQANRTRDGKLSATIEGNPTLAQTLAGFEIGRKLDAAGKEVSKPFSYTDPEIGAPQFSSYPMRFVVSSGVSNAPGSRQLGVWQRENAGSPWLLTHSVYPAKSAGVPSLDGLRTPDAADLNNLRSQPAAVARDLAAYLTGGPKAPQASSFAKSASLTNLLELRTKAKTADTAEPYIASVTDAFLPSGEPLAFITSNGDALVFLALTEQYLQRVEPGSNAYWTSGEATAFSSMVKYTQSLHQDYLHQVALVIPSKASGKAVQVLSIDPQLVGAGGV
ncbi:hypothetical protein GCM10009630_59790 [Kribbella jejuensis]|uniref:DUF8094 domain-containing protein n=1 Tax=Kribbella jejuensis TaxID=236068 RepID=A0A542ETL1_9ACTN|nr:hypothetical protein [Kribbella jejuensis]TQJ18691.1 hypothetical protein FB475_2840 [Kribbella jejuensis]